MKVRWSPQARSDRLTIWDYIAADDPDAASRLDEVFGDAARRLTDFPMLGHAGLVPGTRELHPHRNYRLVYEVRDGCVWILAIVQAARQWPPE
ncbi:type II toxin-antitoxin system RelE/ParE family toxin [Sphingobium sp. YR768]|jgi:toxin ParE1/3/4|uniref:type II toxin-antitoxin system RelE/ParE family toxin n=1 Tax=Sphingobium sp. YR768 TaxID=1884365 RepID=UPI0008B28107|nr:type II toxin-antitoxin system RelE/ParE family toxin [Sphingobium sp. YR768]SER74437.1 addiction module toxin, RelE/StbE family [Sphingobium sp. YR768]